MRASRDSALSRAVHDDVEAGDDDWEVRLLLVLERHVHLHAAGEGGRAREHLRAHALAGVVLDSLYQEECRVDKLGPVGRSDGRMVGRSDGAVLLVD